MKGSILELALTPVDLEKWAEEVQFGTESDTGENSRQYLQERLFMSFKGFAKSVGAEGYESTN